VRPYAVESFADELGRLAGPSICVMLKHADVATSLKPHQQRVVDRIKDPKQPGLVVAHGLGSGKTLTSIAAQEALNLPADVVVPASLQANYAKEVGKHVTGKTPERAIQSMQNLAVKGQAPQRKMMILDEAHRIREPSSKAYQTLSKNKAEKRLLMTASPFYNHPSDIAPLINMAAGTKVLPATVKDFEKEYVTSKEVAPPILGRLRGVKPGTVPMLNKKREGELRGNFSKWVDYHKSSTDNPDFPKVKRETINVEMDRDQLKVYDTLMNKAPAWVAYKIKKGLPPSKQEAQQLNSFLIGTRQASNSTLPFETRGAGHDPKLTKAYENLKTVLDANPRAKALVYSNFISAGINPYKKRLDDAKIPYGEFTGDMPKTKRDELVKQYNENKLRALLISSAGGEGLDLKGTRLIQVLDPHWNDEKIKQIEGRGIRYKSHADLPENERDVTVQRYVATRPRSGLMERIHLRKPGGSVDEYLAQRSAEKEALIDQFRQLLPKEKENDAK
jgi:SNF2 family DNA or RNA helicase